MRRASLFIVDTMPGNVQRTWAWPVWPGLERGVTRIVFHQRICRTGAGSFRPNMVDGQDRTNDFRGIRAAEFTFFGEF
jgi:hypothetical protein